MQLKLSHLIALGALVPLGACVHPSQYRKDLAETRAQESQEKSDRLAADSSQGMEIAGVKNDVAGLRASLDSMRTEFDAKIAEVAQGMKFDMPVTFGFNDATVSDGDHAALDKFAAVAKKYYNGSKITVEGFADPAGTKRYNLVLSQKRADAVRDYLAQQGIDVAELKSVGYGKTRLVNPGASKDAPGAEENRRVVFVIETKSDADQDVPPAGKTTASAASFSHAG